MFGKVTRIVVSNFVISKVISRKNFKRGGKHPSLSLSLPARLGLNLVEKMAFMIHFQNFLAKMIASGRVQG